jgi:hypothetical protein
MKKKYLTIKSLFLKYLDGVPAKPLIYKIARDGVT